MSNVKITLVPEGLEELMKSEPIVEALQASADEIVSKCPKGKYETSRYIGKTRANVSVFTTDKDTFFRNLHNNELLKALK